jgi:hypothetical protein
LGLAIGIITGFVLAILLFAWQQRNYRKKLENSFIQREIDRIKLAARNHENEKRHEP